MEQHHSQIEKIFGDSRYPQPSPANSTPLGCRGCDARYLLKGACRSFTYMAEASPPPLYHARRPLPSHSDIVNYAIDPLISFSRHYDLKFTMPGFIRRLRARSHADPRPAAPSTDHIRSQPSADPGLAVPRPDHIHFQPSLGRDGRPDPDPQTVLSQWRSLGALDPKSNGYDELLRTLVDVEGNRKVAMKFTDNDVGIVINTIGEVSFCDIFSRVSTTPHT